MKQLQYVLIALFLIGFAFSGFAKEMTMQEIEKDLVKIFEQIKPNKDYDLMIKLNAQFRNKLVGYIEKYPETLNYPFQSLVDMGFICITSEDGLFRIYNWDTWEGGTMHCFINIFVYKSNGKVYCFPIKEVSSFDDSGKPVEEIPYFFSEIYTMKSNNVTYYLVIENGLFSNKDCSQSIIIYTIENNELIKASIIEGAGSKISFPFNFFSVVDRPERPLRLIKFDPGKKIIYIPIVYDDGTVTDRFIIYQFNGEYFKYLKTEKKQKNNQGKFSSL